MAAQTDLLTIPRVSGAAVFDPAQDKSSARDWAAGLLRRAWSRLIALPDRDAEAGEAPPPEFFRFPWP